jgi:hypothetical protein
MQDLEESLRQTQARNADLVAQLCTLESALSDSQAKNSALLLQMEEAKSKTFKEEAKNKIFKESSQSTESAESAERKAEEASCKPPRDQGEVLASGESSTKAHSQQPDMNPADETCSRASSGDSKYVRREVLEQVKKKAKADLAELENELMTVVLTMESDCARQAQEQQVATPTLLQTPPGVTGWSKPAASLLTAGWQIGEQQERIQLLEMDKEMLILERAELCQSLAAKNAELVKTKDILDQQLVHLQQSQRPTAMLELDEDRDRELREEGAREVSNAADDQIQFLLQAGSAEISSLKSQVNLLLDQLQRVVGSKNASLALNSNTPSGGCVIFPANSSPPPIAGGRISLQAEGARERGRESSSSSSCSSSGKHAGSIPAGSIDGFPCQQVLAEEAAWLQEMEEGEKAHAETGEALQLHGNRTHANSENLGAPQDSGRSITDSKGKIQHKVSNSVGQMSVTDIDICFRYDS